MAKQENRSLVPVAKQLPATRPAKTSKQSFSLYDGERHFTDREDVREFLPDILGKALARTWIDADFQTAFDNDPCGTLESHGVFLPVFWAFLSTPATHKRRWKTGLSKKR